jgi:hypothetical protein
MGLEPEGLILKQYNCADRGQPSSSLRIFFPTVLNLAPLQVQNSSACGGLRQLNLRALRCDKNGDPEKRYSLG